MLLQTNVLRSGLLFVVCTLPSIYAARPILSANVAAGGRKLVQQTYPMPTADCAGYTEPRKFTEFASWWTPMSSEITGLSQRMIVSACLPAGPQLTKSFTVDVAITLVNCAFTGRYVDSLYLSIGSTIIDGLEEMALSCCLSACSEVYRLTADINEFDYNDNVTLRLEAVMKSKGSDKLPDNVFSRAGVEVPYTLQLLNRTTRNEQDVSTETVAYSWGRKPFQAAVVKLLELAPVEPLTSASWVVPFEMYAESVDSDAPTMLSSLLAAINPGFNDTMINPTFDGAPNILKYRGFSRASMPQTPVVDVTRSSLGTGYQRFGLRADAFVAPANMPRSNDPTATAAQKAGGSNSVSLTVAFAVASNIIQG